MAKLPASSLIPTPLLIWDSLKYGNASALESLYKLYAAPLYNYGSKFTADQELVKDCIQELFVTLWTKKASLNTPLDVKNYLFKSFRHSIFKKTALLQRNTPFEENDDYHFEASLNMEDLMIMEENDIQIKKRLQSAIDALTPRQKEAIFLKFQENLSYEEIAAIMDITVKASYKLMARSLTFLREHLSKEELYLLFVLLNYKLLR